LVAWQAVEQVNSGKISLHIDTAKWDDAIAALQAPGEICPSVNPDVLTTLIAAATHAIGLPQVMQYFDISVNKKDQLIDLSCNTLVKSLQK